MTTDVSRWFKRAKPPTSAVRPIALTCEVGGRSPRPNHVLTHVVTSRSLLQPGSRSVEDPIHISVFFIRDAYR